MAVFLFFPIFNAKQFNKPVSDDFLPMWREKVLANPYFQLSDWLRHINAGNSQGEIYERESEIRSSFLIIEQVVKKLLLPDRY